MDRNRTEKLTRRRAPSNFQFIADLGAAQGEAQQRTRLVAKATPRLERRQSTPAV